MKVPHILSPKGTPLDVPSGDLVFTFTEDGHLSIHIGEKPIGWREWAMIAAYSQFQVTSFLGTQAMTAAMGSAEIARMAAELNGGKPS
jgi:hypothetical protein